MPPIKTLSQIPTITELYRASALRPAVSPIFPPLPNLNDKVGLIRGDITTLSLDAIVNAANSSLLGGGGVDGAIHRAAGPALRAECARLGGCPTGEARFSQGHDLPAKSVIHTVGPVYSQRERAASEALLRSCYEESLKLAVERGVASLAFSGISTGVYGYPSRDAAMVACETVRRFLEGGEGKSLARVVFVTFEQKDVDSYNELLPKYFPPADAVNGDH